MSEIERSGCLFESRPQQIGPHVVKDVRAADTSTGRKCLT